MRAALPEPPSKSAESGEREAGWLIERWDSRRNELLCEWWTLGSCGDGDFEATGEWSRDDNRALRFARERDAQAYIDATGWTEAKPTEHRWG